MPAVPWTVAEPAHADRERAAMADVAPALRWTTGLTLLDRSDLSGFVGPLPQWCADRAMPPGVAELLGADQVSVEVIFSEATPMVPPAIRAINPDVPLARRTDHRWHINGDGTLCQLQGAVAWPPGTTAEALLVKASCWYVEYRLMEHGLIEAMSESGIAEDPVHDATLAQLVP